MRQSKKINSLDFFIDTNPLVLLMFDSSNFKNYCSLFKEIQKYEKWKVLHLVSKDEIFFPFKEKLYPPVCSPCLPVCKPEGIGRGIAIRA